MGLSDVQNIREMLNLLDFEKNSAMVSLYRHPPFGSNLAHGTGFWNIFLFRPAGNVAFEG